MPLPAVWQVKRQRQLVLLSQISLTAISQFLAKGIDDIAAMYKYNIVLASSDEDDDKEVNVVNTLFAKQVDGIIFMGHHLTEKIRAEFSRSRTPVVLAGTVDLEHQLPSVNIDYKAAVADVVDILAKNNKEIAFVSGPLIDDINGKVRLSRIQRRT
jgi:LacI family transcriptional regulator